MSVDFEKGLRLEKPGPEASPTDHGIWAFAKVAFVSGFPNPRRKRLEHPRDAVAFLMGPGERDVTWNPIDGSRAIVVADEEDAAFLPPGWGTGVVRKQQFHKPEPATKLPTGDQDALLKPAEAAEECGVSTNSIHRWRKEGRKGIKLRSTWIGGTLRIRRGDLADYFNELADLENQFPTEEEPEENPEERLAKAYSACEALGC